MCERIHPENWHLKRFAPFCLVGLLVGAACGAPDEVKRASVTSSGQTGGSTGGAGSSGSSVSSSSAPGGSTTAGSISTSSASGGKTSSGGSTATAGNGGSSSSSKGGSSSGAAGAGSTSTTKSSGGAGSTGSSSSYPPVGGTTGGTTSATAGATTGGTSGTSTSTEAPPPTDSLAAYVAQKPQGSGAQVSFSFEIHNLTDKPVDLSNVSLRYWYQDEGLGASPVIEFDYTSIGKASGSVAAASPSSPGADHYLQITFTGATIAAKGAMSDGDKQKVTGRVHTANYQGPTIDPSNDYSYNEGSVGFDKRITLHDKSGNVIAGTPPSGSSSSAPTNPEPVDAGARDSSSVD